jgi:hypothetical protein
MSNARAFDTNSSAQSLKSFYFLTVFISDDIHRRYNWMDMLFDQKKLHLPFVRTKGNQKPPAEKKRAKRHYGPLKETIAPARSTQF